MSNPGPAVTTQTNFQALEGLRLTAAQIASPSPDILANTTAMDVGSFM